MIRVGFSMSDRGATWLGGANYFRNLLSALSLLQERRIQPVVFVHSRAPESFVRNFPNAEIVRSEIVDLRTPGGLVRWAIKELCGQRDVLFENLLARHNIDVLSHTFCPLWRDSRIKTIGWIPDFQHMHLPEFFDERELVRRDNAYRKIVIGCDCVLLSSEDAQRDLVKFEPMFVAKSRVLNFVPEVAVDGSLISLHELEEKYGFHAPYFHLPNQFWIHKNHNVVIKALAELKQQGIKATVLVTGNTYDHRNPNHFADLMTRVSTFGLEDSFRVLGVVPYCELISLMLHSCAIINPSFFEGWSSTVEEAKALGKTVLLSNLNVHREQNPIRGIFFDPANAKELAEKMLLIMSDAGKQSGDNKLTYSNSYQSDRLRFAQRYQNIVVDLVCKSE